MRSRDSEHRIVAALPPSRGLPAPGEALAIALILLVALALRVFILGNSAAQDDAYITYRYASNLAASNGLVYNPGERVLGTTTPLFALLLALPAWFGLSPESVAPVLGVVFDLMVGIVGWLSLRLVRQTAIAWLWLIAYSTFYMSLQACGNGMETQLFVFLVIAAMASYEWGRDVPAGILIGFGALARPEALLLVVLFVIDRLARKRPPLRSLMAPGLATLSVLVPWTIISTLYYGSPVPHSMIAKHLSSNASIAAWFQFFFSRNPIVAALWLMYLIGIWASIRSHTRWSRLWLVWTAVYAAFFIVGRPPFFGAWYFLPVVPGLLLGAILGADALLAPVLRAATPRRILMGGTWMVFMTLLFPRNVTAVHAFKSAMRQVYIPMGGWIRDHSSADDTIFAGDIGYVGWVSRRRILDAAGLVSPRTLEYYRDHSDEPFAALGLVLEERPRLVVISTNSPAAKHWRSEEFTAVYTPAIRFCLAGTESDSPRPGLDPDYTIFELRHGSP